MTAAWQTYPGAPAPGTRLCAESDVPGGAALSLKAGSFPIVILRAGGGLRAYVNACPHQYLPLDHRSAQILSADGARLICSNHDAIFDAETGEGLGGWGKGCTLDEIKVEVTGGDVTIAPQP